MEKMINFDNEIKKILNKEFKLNEEFENKVLLSLNSKSKLKEKTNIVIYLSAAILLLLNIYATSKLIPSDNIKSKYDLNRSELINHTSKYYTNYQYLN